MDNLVPMYECTVRGQYQAQDGRNRILKTFGPVTFILPEYVEIPNGKKRVNKTVDGTVVQTWEPQFKRCAITTDNVALYIVQRRLLPTWLATAHTDCATFRTCSIVPGGLRRVMRPAKDAQVYDKPVSEMSLQELVSFCKTRQLSVQVLAFTDVKEAREAVLYELEVTGLAKPSGKSTPAPAQEEVPAGVVAKAGAVSSADGVATDQEDPALGLL